MSKLLLLKIICFILNSVVSQTVFNCQLAFLSKYQWNYSIDITLPKVCTSIIGEDNNGQLYHARNLDFGLFLGWDNGNDTWLMSERLRKIVVNVDFQRDGKTVYQVR